MGGFHTNYADTLEATAASFAADGTWSSRTARLGLAGSIASFEGGGLAAQGSANAGRVLTSHRGRGLVTTADATGYGFEGGAWAGMASLGLGGITPVGSSAGTLALAAGGIRRIDTTDDLLLQATARLRREYGIWAADAWASATRTGDVAYADLAAALQAAWPRFTLDASGGARLGDLGDVAWGQVRAAWRVAGPGWVEMSAGRYPPDPTGFASGTFVQAGIRVALGRETAGVARPSESAVAITHEPDGTVLVILTVADRVPAAIAGDWNGWSAQPLDRVDERRWRARLVLLPGLHRFTLLDAEGNAFVPAGVLAEPDEFATMTGLLAVPHR